MSQFRFGLAGICAALLVFLTASVFAQDASLPAWADLAAGEWAMIPTGGDTLCSNGTPYSFFARPAAEPSDKLLIHFQGGGACWFGENCKLDRNPTYDPFVDESDNPASYNMGIFNFENEANPFSDYNMVMVPYCTGDVHVGATDQEYTVAADGDKPEETFTIYHRGAINAAEVLGWTFENVAEPETVFVTGCSAGSIPSPLYTQAVAEAYPAARIEQLGDAAGAYRNQPLASTVFEQWGTLDILPEAYAEYTLETLNFEAFYIESAAAFPEITFTQYNAAYDGVQSGFLMLGGLMEFELPELLEQNYADIQAADADNFFSFTVGGDSHCVTVLDDFYTYGVGETAFVDWVAALAVGDEMSDVACTDCEEVELLDE
jgi:hypothetical protein